MAEGEDEESHWDYHHNKEKAQILNPVMLAKEEDFLDDNDNGKNENVWNQDPDKGDLHWGPSVARPHLVHNDYHDREKHHGHSTLQNVATAVIHPQHPINSQYFLSAGSDGGIALSTISRLCGAGGAPPSAQ